MAKKKIVGQHGNQNRSGSARDAWRRKKTIMKTLTGKKKNQSEFKGNKSLKTVIQNLKKQGGRGTQAFIHNGYSEGNLGGAIISNIKGNKAYKNVKLVYGDHNNPKKGGVIVYDIGARSTKDVLGWMNGVKAMWKDKEYMKLMQETGNLPHGANTLANKIMGLQVSKSGSIIANVKMPDYVSATSYDSKGNPVSTKKGYRKPTTLGGGNTTVKPTTPNAGSGTSTGPTFNQPIVTNIEGTGKVKMPKADFKELNASNLTPEQWGQMSNSQKFLTIAKMSSPAFKADKANEFAKKMETKAKNISRGIGIAGKAVGSIGKGLSSGYRKGWGSR